MSEKINPHGFEDSEFKKFYNPSEIIEGLDTNNLPTLDQAKTDTSIAQNIFEKKIKPHLLEGIPKDFTSAEYAGNAVRYVVDEPWLNDKKYERKLYSESKEVAKMFQGEIVVDLGSGHNDAGYYIAREGGAKAYIAVEPVFFAELEVTLKGRIESEIKMKCAIVPEDMFNFLRRLPDKSVSIFTGGILPDLIPDRKYLEAVGMEINRVLSVKGVYVSTASAIYPPNLKQSHKGVFDVYTRQDKERK